MSEYTDIQKKLSKSEKLERELNLKQLQVNRLLTITQAINDNVKAAGLFEMYRSFLGWEMGVKKMILYYKKEESWAVATSLGVEEELIEKDITNQLGKFRRTNHISEKDHPLLKLFDVVIPVLHKETPIAYAFISGFSEDEDLYNKVQFITTITNIVAVAIENKRLFKRQLEQERLRHEMELAREMQLSLIPKNLPTKDRYELSSIYRPHQIVGGDYFDFIEFEDGVFTFCVGDISGKGVAAALLMANFQANFHTLVRKRMDLKTFIHEINESLLQITKGEKFITFFVGTYNLNTRELQYINAGHNRPILVTNGTVRKLDKGCTILGMFEKLPEVQSETITLENESMILAYTDGLTDMENENGDYLTEDLVKDFVQRHQHCSANEFNEHLLDYIDSFKGRKTYTDDFTVLTCKIR
ncbi:MAG: SpoIIE family protein phosphatase [Saprospiraceae bacterium]